MRSRFLLLIAILNLFSTPILAQTAKTAVMIVGTFHMANPGRDLHDVYVDDVLAPKRQTEIAQIVSSLVRFHPTQIDVEDDAASVAGTYPAFAKGTLPPSRSEVVQLGYRLAQAAGAPVFGVDADGDFPYEPVQTYAKAHGVSDLLAANEAGIVKYVRTLQAIIDSGPLSRALRYANDPATVRESNAFYGDMLRIGGGSQQPGADLLAAWYKRNSYICANIVQPAKPGSRIIVIYGAGHLTRLRNCVGEVPGFELVEPNDYLAN